MALLIIYKWERRHYERDTRTSRWHETGEVDVSYITPEWKRAKTGRDECSWWRAIGAYVRVTHDPYGSPYGTVTRFLNIRPDGLEKCSEVFTPVSMYDAYNAGGWRERQALTEAYDQRMFELVENTDEHVCVRFGTETTATWDFVTERWVG